MAGGSLASDTLAIYALTYDGLTRMGDFRSAQGVGIRKVAKVREGVRLSDGTLGGATITVMTSTVLAITALATAVLGAKSCRPLIGLALPQPILGDPCRSNSSSCGLLGDGQGIRHGGEDLVG